ncbi:MAG: AAA family ATPase, partial [Asticcacaulis sp.]|nr:AAA family ATPase [Asticcacaulis sp.]
MLYRLEIENFFSIRDRQVIDLSIPSNVSDPDNRYSPIFEGSDIRAPKVVAIYGANASGKTTLLKAIQFIASFIRDSSQAKGFVTPLERFNDEESMNRPICLAIEMGGIMDYNQAVKADIQSGRPFNPGTWRYELEIEVKDGTFTRVLMEALRQRPQGKGKWQRIFERNVEGKVLGSSSFKIARFHHLVTTLRPIESVLAAFAHFGHPTAALYVGEAREVLGNLEGNYSPANDNFIMGFMANNPNMLERLNRDLSRIDVGVEHLRFVDSPNGPQAMFKHSGLHLEMPWILESQGTHAFIRLFPVLAVTLERGGTALIDEFDTLIHPAILPELLRWFYDRSDRNPHDAQIWL